MTPSAAGRATVWTAAVSATVVAPHSAPFALGVAVAKEIFDLLRARNDRVSNLSYIRAARATSYLNVNSSAAAPTVTLCNKFSSTGPPRQEEGANPVANETRQFVDNGPEPGEFLEDNYEDLLGYAASHARNWEDARDAVQDVIVNMLKYHQANGRLCPIDRNPVAYWKTSIANYIYGEHRRRSRQGKLSRRLFSPPDDFTEDILDNLIAKEGLEFIGTLNGRDHQIATMRWGEGLTPKQIAQKLGLNANSVRVSLYRTRKKMRIRLGIVGEPPQVLSKETT